MKKSGVGMFGSAIWLTKDGDKIHTDNHLENLVQRYFDLDWFRQHWAEYASTYGTEDSDNLEPNTEIVSEEQFQTLIEQSEYIQNDMGEGMGELQIGEIPSIARVFEQNGLTNAALAIKEIGNEACSGGFESVINGNVQPYHFAFKRGDIRIRLFPNAFAAELDAAQLNRESAGRIIDTFFEMIQGDISNVPEDFALDLIDFSGPTPRTKSFNFNTMEEFFDALGRFKRTASINAILKMATIFYQNVKS